ncbi:MAG: SRPBCC family protein, partial [Candidatus Sericytochromatia bacterium]
MSANLNMARGTTAPTAHRLAGAGLVVPPAVRTASAVVGGLLLVGGMRRRSLGGAVMSLLGGAIVQQALLGRSTVAKAIGAVAGGATEDAAPRTYTVTRTATSLADAETIYALWRDPQALNEIFAGIAEVTVLDENRTHWEVTGPLGLGVAWTTIYTDVQPNAFLRWESLAGAPLTNGGAHTLRPPP